MVTTTFLGTQPRPFPWVQLSGTTWARVRAPLCTVRLNGYSWDWYDGTSPDHWSKQYSTGYLKPYSPPLKAFPLSLRTTGGTGEQNVVEGTPIGIHATTENFEAYVGYTMKLYLAIGQAAYAPWLQPQYYEASPSYGPYGVFIGNKFDYNTVRKTYVGATVNLTYYSQDGTPNTMDVVITEDMFPYDYTPSEYPSYPISGGTYFQTMYYSFTEPDNRPKDWWTINSVTLPS